MPTDKKIDRTEYKNKFVLNQRGGTLEINNSTEREEVKLSQFSGSNITMNNVVNSETASNNKQTKIVFDEYKTVGNTENTFIGKDRNLRVVENNYELKGFEDETQIAAFGEWKEKYRDVANKNSEFEVSRGGKTISSPELKLKQSGSRTRNPDFEYEGPAVYNNFLGYIPLEGVWSYGKNNGIIPAAGSVVWSYYDGTEQYETVIRDLDPPEAQPISPTMKNIKEAFGSEYGTEAPGILEGNLMTSSATEDGKWSKRASISNLITKKQAELNPIEQKMGNGGDDIIFTKRHKIESIGATFNDYPSLRVDPKGRSQATEVGVSADRVFKHYDYISHAEEIENDSNFPCGNYTQSVGNKYNILVGSGGVQINTSGAIHLNGSCVQMTGAKVDIVADHGVAICSDSHINLTSKKIQFNSERQVYVDSSFGVLNNIIVGGGALIEGELYVNHITAPIEVQETLHTQCHGELVEDILIGYAYLDPNLWIGSGVTGFYFDGQFIELWVDVYGSGNEMPVYSLSTPDAVKIYDHSHHFHNLPLRLTTNQKDVRKFAAYENINKPLYPTPARVQRHEFKLPEKIEDLK